MASVAAARCAVRSGTDSLLARTACIIVRQDPQMLRLSQACVQSGDFRWEPLGLYRPCSGCSGHVVIALWWHACVLCVCVCVCVCVCTCGIQGMVMHVSFVLCELPRAECGSAASRRTYDATQGRSRLGAAGRGSTILMAQHARYFESRTVRHGRLRRSRYGAEKSVLKNVGK